MVADNANPADGDYSVMFTGDAERAMSSFTPLRMTA